MTFGRGVTESFLPILVSRTPDLTVSSRLSLRWTRGPSFLRDVLAPSRCAPVLSPCRRHTGPVTPTPSVEAAGLRGGSRVSAEVSTLVSSRGPVSRGREKTPVGASRVRFVMYAPAAVPVRPSGTCPSCPRPSRLWRRDCRG